MRLILIVDDEARLRRGLRKAFMRAGFEVIESSHGVDALGVIHTQKRLGHPVDAVVLDYVMPEMCGDDVLREIRKTDTKIPVVMFTGACTRQV